MNGCDELNTEMAKADGGMLCRQCYNAQSITAGFSTAALLCSSEMRLQGILLSTKSSPIYSTSCRSTKPSLSPELAPGGALFSCVCKAFYNPATKAKARLVEDCKYQTCSKDYSEHQALLRSKSCKPTTKIVSLQPLHRLHVRFL